MNTTITLDPSILNFVLGVALPMVVAIVTKRFAESGFKAIVLLVLSGVAAWISELSANGGTFVFKEALGNFVLIALVAVGTHYGFLKPTGITGSQGVIAKAVPAGIGPVAPVSH